MSVWLQSKARCVSVCVCVCACVCVWLVVVYGLRSFVLAQPLLELVPCRLRGVDCCLVGRRRELLASCLLAL